MAITSVNEIEAGTHILFRTKNPNDPTLWKGVLEGKLTYALARSYTDPAAFNAAVRQADNTVSADVKTLSYFVITVDNDSTVPVTQLFADEWIQPGSLQIINPSSKVRLEVNDPGNDPLHIISILANAGYSSRIVS